MRLLAIFYANSRQNRGSGMVEVAAILCLFFAVVFVFFDFALLFEGAATNDDIAKNAARSAAIGPPGKLEKGRDRIVSENQPPYKRAYIVMQSQRARLWRDFEIVEPLKVTETVNAPVPSELFGGPVNGTVTVETKMVIHPRFILGRFLPLDMRTLIASKTFPYTWVMKSQLSSQPNSNPNGNNNANYNNAGNGTANYNTY